MNDVNLEYNKYSKCFTRKENLSKRLVKFDTIRSVFICKIFCINTGRFESVRYHPFGIPLSSDLRSSHRDHDYSKFWVRVGQ